MSDSIKISPKHGLNTTMPICFWCGKEKNEVVVMGKIDKKDSKAPMKVITDYEPCERCKSIFDKGIQVVGVTDNPVIDNMFPIVNDENYCLYPTGAMFVGTEEWVVKFLTENESAHMVPDVLKKKVLMLPTEVVEAFVKELKENDIPVPEMDVEVPEEIEEDADENKDN